MTAASNAPVCPVCQCQVFPGMTVLPGDTRVVSPLADPSEAPRGDWTGELVLQPCGHTLSPEQQDAWLAEYEGGAA